MSLINIFVFNELKCKKLNIFYLKTINEDYFFKNKKAK